MVFCGFTRKTFLLPVWPFSTWIICQFESLTISIVSAQELLCLWQAPAEEQGCDHLYDQPTLHRRSSPVPLALLVSLCLEHFMTLRFSHWHEDHTFLKYKHSCKHYTLRLESQHWRKEIMANSFQPQTGIQTLCFLSRKGSNNKISLLRSWFPF